MKLQNIKVSTKLLVTNLIVVLSLCAAAVWMVRSVSATLNEANQRVDDLSHIVQLSKEWKGLTDANIQRFISASFATSPAAVEATLKRFAANSKEISSVQSQLKTLSVAPEDAQAMAKIAAIHARIDANQEEVKRLTLEADATAVEAYIEATLQATLADYLAALDDFVKLQEAHRDEAQKAASAAQATTEWLGFGLMAIVAIASLAWMALVSRSIVGPLQRAVHVANAIAAGDLTQNMESGNRQDEIGKLLGALSSMESKLRQVVAEVRQGVESVSVASTELAEGNLNLSARTEQAASNLEEAATSMEELTGTVAQSADSAAQARVLADSAADAATRGHAVVVDVIARMREISDSSRRISDITALIDSIAFQTNILALNAAVEAARAGDQGRGFAVVATEVRALATRSADAAKQIKSLITASVEKVSAGSALVAQTGEAIAEIEVSVKRAKDMMGEISAATKEQRDGIAQVSQSMAQLDEMTQQNAALVEESLAATTSMRDQATTLASLVAMFKVA